MTPSCRLLCARSLLVLTPAMLAVGLALTSRVTQAGPRDRLPDPEQLRGRDLERQRQVALRRMQARLQIVEELAAGRMDLLEAAGRFRDLNETLPEFSREVLHRYFPGASEEERYCRQVLAWVDSELTHRDARLASATTGRLERQLEEYLRRGGPRLPLLAAREGAPAP